MSLVLRTILFLFLSSSLALAHKTGLSFLLIHEFGDNKITITYKKPLEDSQENGIVIRFPIGCKQIPLEARTIENGYIIEQSTLLCENETLIGSRIWVEGLVSSDRGIMIHYSKDSFIAKGLLRASTPFMLINKVHSSWRVAYDYIQLGITHILNGLDHLFFILGLLLLVSNVRALLFAITAFTISHSLTLILGIFDLITISGVYVESMIALSVIFLAREILRKEMTFTKKYLGAVSFIFGLLHGLGFSSVLTSIGLPQGDIPLALFAFNVGIEIGQLLFIAFVGIVYVVIKRSVLFQDNNIKRIIAYVIGTISAFWFIERLVLF